MAPTDQPGLGPDLTIAQAAAVRERLLQHLAAADADLTLDLSDVTDCDSSGLQLLLAARASLQQRGHTLHLAATSLVLDSALATFGLQDFGVPAPAASTH